MFQRTLTSIEQLIADLGYTEKFGLGLWASDNADTPVFDTNSGTAKMMHSINASSDDYIGFAETKEELDELFVLWTKHQEQLAKPIAEHMLPDYIKGINHEAFEQYKGPAGPTEGQCDRNTIALFCEARHECAANIDLVRTNILGTDDTAVMIKLPNGVTMSYDRWGFCADNSDVMLDQASYDAALEYILINS